MSKCKLFSMKRSVKNGTRSFVGGVAVLAILIAIQLLVGALPAGITQFDASGLGMTEISEESKRLVSSLSEDVTIYWLCEEGVEDTQLRLLLSRYEEAGKHVRVKVVDPQKEAALVATYTETSLSPYSFIVTSARRHMVIDARDLYYYTNLLFSVVYQQFPQYLPQSLLQPLTARELTSACSQYGNMITYLLAQLGHTVEDITPFNAPHSFCAEAQLTAALDYVTRSYIPRPYVLTGLGDMAPSETLCGFLETMELVPEELELSSVGEIPEDANCLILYAPSRDLTSEEAAVIARYVNRGGSLMLNTSPELVEACPNLQSVVGLFGLSAVPGLIREGDTGYISGSQFTLVPTVSTEHAATAYVTSGGFKPKLPNCHAIAVAETLPAGVTVTPLFTTSDKAVPVSLQDRSTPCGSEGTRALAMAAAKSITTSEGTEETADLVWFANADGFTDAVAETQSGGNYYFYAATMSLIGDRFTSSYSQLSPVVLPRDTLSVPEGTALGLAAVTVVLLPLLLLGVGLGIWIRRKRR